MTPEKLCALAIEAMSHAYVPYSGYKVGAALLCADGTVYQGCNIENAAYGPTNCAERTAFFKAVYDGPRDFKAIAVCGGKPSPRRKPLMGLEVILPSIVFRLVPALFLRESPIRSIPKRNRARPQSRGRTISRIISIEIYLGIIFFR